MTHLKKSVEACFFSIGLSEGEVILAGLFLDRLQRVAKIWIKPPPFFGFSSHTSEEDQS